MEGLVREFLCYLEQERNRSVCTVENYGADLNAFCKYVRQLDEELSWEDVDTSIVRGWMEEMADNGNKSSSVNRRLCSLRAFFRYGVSCGKLHCNPACRIKGSKKEKPLPQYLRDEEMERLLDKKYWDETFADVRLRTIILTFYSTGIRLAELQGLDDGSVDRQQDVLRVVGKRNKVRLVPFGEELKSELASYQMMRNDMFGGGSGALFVDDGGERMTSRRIRSEVIKCISMVTTMKKRSPHVLRHTFATAMLDNGSGIEEVRKLLGHGSVSTTEVYTHTSFGQLRKAYSGAHPRGRTPEKRDWEDELCRLGDSPIKRGVVRTKRYAEVTAILK